MLKLCTMIHTRKELTDQDVERFLFHHPYIGILLCSIVMPMLLLMSVSALCCAVMLPISFFMGWL